MKWIFRYLDGAMNETDMGEIINKEEVPFADKNKCNKEMRRMTQFGAMTAGPIEVEDDYKIYKPKYDE